MNLELAGSTAVVVGGASGIGLAIAQAFAAEGANTALLDPAPHTAEAAAGIGVKAPQQATGLQVDATDYEAVVAAFGQVHAAWGRIDHVVVAAGAGSGKYGYPFWNLEPGDWRRPLEVNLLGTVHAAHACVPYFTQAKAGTLLFLSSVAAQIGSQTDPPYSAAKAAVINFAQCAAKDFAPLGVRVNTICPGMVKTAVNRSVWQAWANQQPEAERLSYEAWADDKVSRIAPLKRWQEPEDIGAMAVFLASPQAKNITGQTLNVDGGQVMHS
ncbi:SDR family NAD(P)-dependent oxidoreductase [Lignipirellula cremea]|uniref:Diacetyl reductase [(S)-acetoin forming] n=1 Tax=Lignipirellula cremea TaxID=2528010 RepID=A0A518E573_9BACT|nr:SDR family oxidoreductase [Lignipirellula cremea]QDU99223.1 Diacetyl reductase [(S)-acetoin forming] [Lignipirellula cremea]